MEHVRAGRHQVGCRPSRIVVTSRRAFTEPLSRALLSEDAGCRERAFALVVRLVKHAPTQAALLLPAFFESLHSARLPVRRTALANAHHFFVAAPEQAVQILTQLFQAGKHLTDEGRAAFVKILQRMHLT